MPASDSKAFFKEYLKKEGLFSDVRWANLVRHNWDTISNYAFAWGQLEAGKVPTEAEFKAVVAKIEGYDWEDRRTWPGRPLFGGPFEEPTEPK